MRNDRLDDGEEGEMQLARKPSLLPAQHSPPQPPDPTADDDLRLVLLARSDPAAFAPLYERYGQIIYFFCYRRLNDVSDAEDATATIFVRALNSLPRFQPETSRHGSTFRAWLFAIARNVLTDSHRRRRSHISMNGDADSLHAIVQVPDHQPGPEAQVLGAEEARLVHELLNELPDRQRAVVELRLAGLSMAEVAATLDLSEPAAKSLQVRAYRTLRDLLQANPSALTREHFP